MNSAVYAACAGLVSRTEALDAIANNMANESTPGFRARQNIFRSMLAARGNPMLSTLNQDANDYNVLAATRLDTTQGSLTRTNNDLDVAIEGSGYLQVQTAKGTMYTRAGNLKLSAQGQLVTANGDPVLGDQGPINIAGQPVTIGSDGTVAVNGVTTGKLTLVDFDPAVELASVGNTYLQAPAGTTPAASDASLRQGMLESSNVNPVSTVVDLINAQREVETMRRVLTMMNDDMDKTATQDLPHVG